jgi:hypothetical protein
VEVVGEREREVEREREKGQSISPIGVVVVWIH